MPTTVTRNALAPAHQLAEDLNRRMVGLAITLDMRSRRQQPDLDPAAAAAIAEDLASLDAGLAALWCELGPYVAQAAGARQTAAAPC